MNKRKFKKLMNRWEKLFKSEEKLNKAMKEWDKEFGHLSFGVYHELIEDLFKTAFNDKWDWISYYVYDLNFGKEKCGVWNTESSLLSIYPIKSLDDIWEEITKSK